ncbi:MAG TPA: polyprenyl diphosphate synthase [Chloroflexota bacterium]|nr:polyprenyl diphosphate synthase [Chloroflexota bacterium]
MTTTATEDGSQAPARVRGGGPRHVAIIMDGNGRWAQRRHLPRLEGHRHGVDNIHTIVLAAIDLGIEVVTLYAFSTENWGRPRDEVSGLMRLFTLISRRETANLHREGVQVRHIGSLEGVSPPLARAIEDAVALTRHNTRLQLNIAFNYGGRAEIVRAVRLLMESGVAPAEVTEDLIAQHLYTGAGPDPDLIIRTAGEMRLSNFLLWQAAYSEYYACPKLWPDFGAEDLRAAVASFAGRHRKYGRL